MNTTYTVFPLQSSQGLGGKRRGEPGSGSQQPAQRPERDTKSAPQCDAVGTRAVGGEGQENPHTCTGAGGTLTSPVLGPSVIALAGRGNHHPTGFCISQAQSRLGLLPGRLSHC